MSKTPHTISLNEKCRKDFRHFLIDAMAKVDCIHLFDNYDYHYKHLSDYSDFSLLQYWLTYHGVFDGGESNLNELKRLISYSPTCNPKSVIENLNL